LGPKEGEGEHGPVRGGGDKEGEKLEKRLNRTNHVLRSQGGGVNGELGGRKKQRKLGRVCVVE